MFPAIADADVDDGAHDDASDLDGIADTDRSYRVDGPTTPTTTATAAAIVLDADDGLDDRRILVVYLRRVQQTLRERPLLSTDLAQALVGKPLLVRQGARYIEVADEG